jgi:hypothetical protein
LAINNYRLLNSIQCSYANPHQDPRERDRGAG